MSKKVNENSVQQEQITIMKFISGYCMNTRPIFNHFSSFSIALSISAISFLNVFQESLLRDIPFLVGKYSPSFSKNYLILTIGFPLNTLTDTLLFLVKLQNSSPVFVFSLTGLSKRSSASLELKESQSLSQPLCFLSFFYDLAYFLDIVSKAQCLGLLIIFLWLSNQKFSIIHYRNKIISKKTYSFYNTLIYYKLPKMQVNQDNWIQLIMGIFGTFMSLSVTGYLTEKIITKQFSNMLTKQNQLFVSPLNLVCFTTATMWIVLSCVSICQAVPQQQKLKQKIQKYSRNSEEYQEIANQNSAQWTAVPIKEQMKLGATSCISLVAFLYAVKWNSFPIAMIMKAVSIIGSLNCYKSVQDDDTKITDSGRFVKFIIAACSLIVAYLFLWFSPQNSTQGFSFKHFAEKQLTQVKGYFSIAIFLLVDALKFAKQQSLKDKSHKFSSIYEKLSVQNKWGFFLGYLLTFAIGEQIYISVFVWIHPTFLLYLIAFAMVYVSHQMITHNFYESFKPILSDFLVCIQRLVCIGGSIITFQHQVNTAQILCIFSILLLALINFIYELANQKSNKRKYQQQKNPQFKRVHRSLEDRQEKERIIQN